MRVVFKTRVKVSFTAMSRPSDACLAQVCLERGLLEEQIVGPGQ